MRTKYFILIIILLISHSLSGQNYKIDFRYSPHHYYTPICFPDDWQKTLVKEDGAMLYDFGPGPYASPYTTISTEIRVGIKGSNLNVKKQHLFQPKIPIVLTELVGENIKIHQEAFSLVPKKEIDSENKFKIRRKIGLNSAIAWSKPRIKADPAFRNVTWGTGRVIRYEYEVNRGDKKLVGLGFCEGRYDKPGIRIFELNIEGTPQKTIDLAETGQNNIPQIHQFEAEDLNQNGQIEIEIAASVKTKDPNTYVNALWIFPKNTNISAQNLITGASNSNAELFVDCGQEPEIQTRGPRLDAMTAKIDGNNFTPIIEIFSRRDFKFDKKSGVLFSLDRPFLTTNPKPISFQKIEDGFILELPQNSKTVEMIVINGYQLPENITQIPNLENAKKRAIRYWQDETDLPYDHIQVSDKKYQELIDSSIRNLYQIRDVVDGLPQFQPGPTVYRGLWLSDGYKQMEAALLAGDIEAAQLMIEAEARYQQEDGKIKVMSPSLLHRETSHFIVTMHRFARLSNDKKWLEENWLWLEKAMNWVVDLRKKSFTDPKALYYGLLPPGLTDGGIGGINPEYGNIYWSLIGMNHAVEAAKWLGKNSIALKWKAEYDDFMAAFRKAVSRDIKKDKNGNLFLPVRMIFDPEKHTPQRGQWGPFHSVFPGKTFTPDDPLVEGTMALLKSNEVQGLVLDSGWLKGGVWPGFATLRGLAHLWKGDIQEAHRLLYTFVNHASPTYVWIEEQLPKDKGIKTAGDCPHTNTNSQVIRFVRYLLALERGHKIELLRGLPEHWIYPGAQIKLNNLPTEFGQLTLNLEIDQSGNSGSISVITQKTQEKREIQLYLGHLRNLGFKQKNGSELPIVWGENWGKKINLEFIK